MAKPKIENIHVDNVTPETRSFAIGWTIGKDRYHVWGRDGEIGETIFKNSIVGSREPGYYRTRAINRSTSTQTAIFAEVWCAVMAGNMIVCAFETERRRIRTQRRRRELAAAIAAIDAEALEAWKTGQFSLHTGYAVAMLDRRHRLELQLADLSKDETDASASSPSLNETALT